MSVWGSHQRQSQGPLGAIPMPSAVPWSNAHENMLVKLAGISPGDKGK